MQITLLTGRAHVKHTEGGDFRQATYRAVRQGLKKAKSILLEPYYEFRLEVPSEMIGRAMSDIQQMQGSFESPETEGDMSVLTGTAAVSQMRDYQKQVVSYTSGRGRLFCNLKGYAPCKNQEAVVQSVGYDSEHDLENPTGSVFCAHGAGFVVPWDQVEEYMHLDSGIDTGLWQRKVKAGMSFRRETMNKTADYCQISQAILLEKNTRRDILTVEAMRTSRNCRRFLSVPLGR